MNKSYTLFISVCILIIAVLIPGCKEDTEDIPEEISLEDKLIANLRVLYDAASVYNDGYQKSNDSLASFIALNNWLVNHPGVNQGFYHNTEFLEVEFNNGLKSSITIIPVDEKGEHLTRGGGSSGMPSEFRFKDIQSKEIKNKKVLLMIPYPDEFYYSSGSIQNLASLISSQDPEMEVDLQIGADADYNDLKKLGDYGLIILDVHGLKYGFNLAFIYEDYELGEIWFPEEVIEAAFNVNSIPKEKVATGEIEISLQIEVDTKNEVDFYFTVVITEECIRQLNVDLSDAIVFGNHCYSGHTADGSTKNNLPEAWRSLGAATYYGYAHADGYSQPVDNNFCKDMEIALIQGLIVDGDTTGSAHLKPDDAEYFYLPSIGYNRAYRKLAPLTVQTGPPQPTSIWPLYFIQYFDTGYEYENCEGELVDERDGTSYKTVCIGDQVWMAENLNYAGGGVCYDNDPANCETFGRLYSIEEATGKQNGANGNVQGICPDGWHIPTVEEVEELISFVGVEGPAGDALKADTLWVGNHTDVFGFAALPGGRGWHINDEPEFFGLGSRASFWTSTIYPIGSSEDYGMYELDAGSQEVGIYTVDEDLEMKLSCRCVKDQE